MTVLQCTGTVSLLTIVCCGSAGIDTILRRPHDLKANIVSRHSTEIMIPEPSDGLQGVFNPTTVRGVNHLELILLSGIVNGLGQSCTKDENVALLKCDALVVGDLLDC